MLGNAYSINGLQVKNRIVMPAVYIGNRFYDKKFQQFYIARAKGETGMIIVPVPTLNGVADVCKKEFMETSRQFVGECHLYGCKLVAQIYSGEGDKVNAFQTQELEQIPDDLALAASKIKEAGYDGLEIHGAHHALFMALLSPCLNQRTDQFGGDFEGRTRLAIQTVQKVRQAVGDKYPVFYRFSGTEFCDSGVDVDMSVRFAKLLEQNGADCLDVSAGGTRCSPKNSECPELSKPEGCFRYIFSAVKKAVNVPVIGAGNIYSNKTAEQILTEGSADLIGVGRAQIASPEWSRRMLEEKETDRTCLENWYRQLPNWKEK